ncbi:MAG: transposase [Clostridia bacterium]|nr:transposase [Clostridia bacterium]
MFVELPKRKRNRLTEYDYSAPNAYFITVCTDKRRNLFWKNVGASIARPQDVQLSDLGAVVEVAVKEIPRRYLAVSVDHYTIMPNHVHLLLRIDTDGSGRPMVAPTISVIMQQFKGIVTKKVGIPIWQKGFYDHVIRSEQDYLDVWNYIEGNPSKWTEDALYMQP